MSTGSWFQTEYEATSFFKMSDILSVFREKFRLIRLANVAVHSRVRNGWTASSTARLIISSNSTEGGADFTALAGVQAKPVFCLLNSDARLSRGQLYT